jgi:hypothetical protein
MGLLDYQCFPDMRSSSACSAQDNNNNNQVAYHTKAGLEAYCRCFLTR